MKPHSIFFSMHPNKSYADKVAINVITQIKNNGIIVYTEKWINERLKTELPVLNIQKLNLTDAIVVLGGDGTLLRIIPWAVKADIPIFAINTGRVGFLTTIDQYELKDALAIFCSGKYIIDERMLLEVDFGQKENIVALNDIVVNRGVYSKLITIDAYISEDHIGRYIADGIIISSPTGSTGYSLSAGGPIVSPKVDCMIVTPICAHSLQHRPVVIDAREKITLKLRSEQGIKYHLVVDGHEPISLNDDTVIRIYKSIKTVKLVRLTYPAFFNLVREKLLEWSR